jgi:septal ring-binding cell division protein DamX
MSIITILLVSCWFSGIAIAQSTNAALPGPENKSVSQYRKKFIFTDPYEKVIPVTRQELAPGQDSTVSKLEVTYETTPAITNLMQMSRPSNIDVLEGEGYNYINSGNKTMELNGYRIQIHSSTSREQAAAAKYRMLEIMREYQVYQVYNRPYYKIRVGDFISRSEADKAAEDLKKYFPSAFVVPEKVFLRGQ